MLDTATELSACALALQLKRRWCVKVKGPRGLGGYFLCDPGGLESGGGGRGEDTQPQSEGEAKEPDTRTKALGRFLCRTGGAAAKRMTSEKYAPAAAHYLR